jgi:hypothetical protein
MARLHALAHGQDRHVDDDGAVVVITACGKKKHSLAVITDDVDKVSCPNCIRELAWQTQDFVSSMAKK